MLQDRFIRIDLLKRIGAPLRVGALPAGALPRYPATFAKAHKTWPFSALCAESSENSVKSGGVVRA